jgi:chromosome segregation ATPase
VSIEKDRTILEIFRDAAAAICFLAVAFLAMKLAMAMDAVEPKIILATENVDRTVIITGAAMANLEKATRSIKAREDAEYDKVQAVSTQLAGVVAGVNGSISKLDSTLDSLTALTQSTNENMGKVEVDADANLRQLQPALSNLNVELEKLPAVTESLNAAIQGMQPIEKNAGEITANTAAITDDAKKTADFYYSKLTAPVSMAKKVGEAAGHYATLFFGAYLGAK